MSEIVEITDDSTEVHVLEKTANAPSALPALDDLRTLKREMEFRGSLLGKTWSELNRIMTQYQAQLVEKHEQLESNISIGEQGRLSNLESSLSKKAGEVQRLQKQVHEIEQKLLSKDSEIVRLRTEVHKFRNEVSMKDSLIEKLQIQMSKEAMEYQSEINSLREILENGSAVGSETTAKRRRVTQTSSTGGAVGTLSHFKSESTPPSCQVKPSSISCQAVFPHPQAQPVSPRQGQGQAGQSMEESYSDTLNVSDSNIERNEDDSYYELEDSYADDSNSGNVMADLLEQKPLMDSGDDVEPQMLIQNVLNAGLQQSQGQELITSDGLLCVPHFTRGSRVAESAQVPPDPSQIRHVVQLAKSNYTMINGRYRCNICGKEFGYKHVVVIHSRTHFGIRPYRCSICGKSSTQKITTLEHVRNKHEIGISNAHEYVVHDRALTDG